MSMSSAEQLFETEARELLDEMVQSLLALEENPSETDQINSIFRAAHTIKGSAGLFGFEEVIEFTHEVESVLDEVRNGKLAISEDLLSLMFTCRDIMERLVEAAVNGIDEDKHQQLQDLSGYIAEKLQVYLSKENPPTQKTEEQLTSTNQESDDEIRTWSISIQFGPDMFRNGMDPMSFVRYLNKLGELEHTALLQDRIPAASDMDPESCYLGIEMILVSSCGLQAINETFEFVIDDCEVVIKECIENADPQASSAANISGIGTSNQVSPELTSPDSKPASEALQDSVETTINKPPADKSKSTSVTAGDTIRVSAEKLGGLINLVGELVICSANTQLLGERTKDSELIESMETMSRIVENIRDTGLGLRMVPIGETFNRFRRVVRDLSKDLNKDIKLEISGADKELDKTVIEKIRDPLIHLIRNAVDHGIEPVEERLANGKTEQATLTLNAYHDSGSIVIEVEDDGAGLPKAKIYEKAIEKGLITPDQELSDQEIFRLIFQAGFSTASTVTDISGRGVGMDVARQNIAALRGDIDVASWPGKGSKFSIRLPLTLAIIDGFLVRVGASCYVIPLDTVEECVQHSFSGECENEYVNLRGEVLPYIRLRDIFGESSEPCKREHIVIVNYAGQKVGFVVDALMGEYQTVIKPLGQLFKNLRGISGATILGSGEVATILDVPALVSRTRSAKRTYMNGAMDSTWKVAS